MTLGDKPAPKDNSRRIARARDFAAAPGATARISMGEKMKPDDPSSGIDRRTLVSALAVLPVLSRSLLPAPAQAQATANSPLPSWNDGPAKQAILDFVRATVDRSSPTFVAPEERIATFDQDGTLWVEHPVYSQVMYCLDRVPAVVEKKPALKKVEPFKTVLSG